MLKDFSSPSNPIDPFSKDYIEELKEIWSERFPDLDVDAAVFFALGEALGWQLNRHLNDTLKRYGHTYAEYVVLTNLMSTGDTQGLSPTKLNESLRFTPAGMTKTLQRLESAGLIERESNPEDRRSVIMVLTPQGVATVERLFRAVNNEQQARLRRITKMERKQLIRILRKLIYPV